MKEFGYNYKDVTTMHSHPFEIYLTFSGGDLLAANRFNFKNTADSSKEGWRKITSTRDELSDIHIIRRLK
ncbi:MAG: hypothetical protein DDT33_01184 [Firmicutes bacterium]|nr:hypothetical protein [Bacillota bacterium]